MADERTAEQIQREIEQARVALADAVDQIARRSSPKRAIQTLKTNLKEKAATPQGKAVLAGAGVLLAILVLRRSRR